MKHIQKLVLVPIEKWEEIGDKSIVKEVSVKTAPLMSPQVPLKAISQMNTLKVKNQQGLGKIKKSNKSQMFLYLPLKKRSKGLLLLHYLEKSENIKWNKTGELLYKGKMIPNSNVIELITHAIQNDKSNPIGMKTFYKILAKANIPIKLIMNKEGRHIMKKTLDEKNNIWRPPGQLNKR